MVEPLGCIPWRAEINFGRPRKTSNSRIMWQISELYLIFFGGRGFINYGTLQMIKLCLREVLKVLTSINVVPAKILSSCKTLEVVV